MTGWTIFACQACGRRPKDGLRAVFPVELQGGDLEPLCVWCYRWFLAWSLGLVVAANEIARWEFLRWRAPSEREG